MGGPHPKDQPFYPFIMTVPYHVFVTLAVREDRGDVRLARITAAPYTLV
jgi:hypothetical protein